VGNGDNFNNNKISELYQYLGAKWETLVSKTHLMAIQNCFRIESILKLPQLQIRHLKTQGWQSL